MLMNQDELHETLKLLNMLELPDYQKIQPYLYTKAANDNEFSKLINIMTAPKIGKQFWTKEQDLMLTTLKSQSTSMCYNSVSALINEKFNTKFTPKQCQQHWTRVIQPGIVKGRWSSQEDEQLVNLIQVYKLSCKQVAKILSTRTSQQIWKRCKDLNIEISSHKIIEN